jgi:ankyrin repeat protein
MRVTALFLAAVSPALAAAQGPSGAPPTSPKGSTPALALRFDEACCHHNEAAALAVIAQGLDVKGADPYGNPPLAEAAEFGLLNVVKALVAHGADVHAPHGHESVMADAIASRKPEIVTFLLAKGVDVNVPVNDVGGTALMKAARLGQIAIVKLLLAQGADLKGHDQAGVDALDEAADFDYADVMVLLLDRGADPNRPGLHGELPINMAARAGYLDAVKLLVAKGAKPDQPSGPGNITPLGSACGGELRPGRDQVGVIEFLLKRGARVSAPDQRGDTPLLLTMHAFGREDILRVLVAAGADIKSANGEGAKAFRFEVQNDFPGAPAKVKALLDVGANPNWIVLNDCPALFWAIEIRPDPEMVAVLAAGKANVNATRSRKPMGEFVGAPPPDYVYTPLIAATKAGSAAMVGALLKAGANPGFKDTDGKTALDYARASNNAEIIALLSRA